jgi:TatD DNase family protein
MLLFDAHSHLSPAAVPTPRTHRIVCATGESDWEAVLAHASGDGRATPMLGLHPWRVAEAAPGWLPHLEALLRTHSAGVGECGLDFARADTDRPAQEAAFRAQLRLAHALRRPVAVHAVKAWGRLLDILREEGVPLAGAMVHAYSGSPDTARALQALGLFLSFSGDLLRPGRSRPREALAAVAPERLLLESDGTADLTLLVEQAARLRGVTAETLASQTWENGQRCFKELLA